MSESRMIQDIRRLVAREEVLRRELREVSLKLAAIRAALGMSPDDAPKDYLDSENPNPYVAIKDLIVGAVNAAGRTVTVKDIQDSVAAVRQLSNEQVGVNLNHAATRWGLIQRVGRGLYAPLDNVTEVADLEPEQLGAEP